VAELPNAVRASTSDIVDSIRMHFSNVRLDIRPMSYMRCNFTRKMGRILVFAAGLLIAGQASSADLLYNWNFNGDTGSTVVNSAGNPGATGGNLTMRNGAGASSDPIAASLHGPGSTGASGDLAFKTTSGSLTSASPVAISSAGDITTGSLSKITITGWLQDTGESNYTDGNTSRILTIGPPGYDGGVGAGIGNPAPNSSLSLGVYNLGNAFGALQLKVNGAAGTFDGVISSNEILPSSANQWFFFAVTYDSTATMAKNGSEYTNTNASQPSVSMYIGSASQSISTAAFSGAYPGITGNTPSSPGPIQFTNAFASLMNRTSSARNLPYVGYGDDFRIYDGVLTPQELNSVRQSSAPLSPGDFNGDGIVNAADLPAMLGAMTNLAQYQADRGLSDDAFKFIGDLNHDTFVTNSDIQNLLDLIKANLPPAMNGDMNRDGHITQADLPLLLQALADFEKYRTDHSLTLAELTTMGDASGDMVFDHDDIQALEDLIASMGGGAVAVPEPSLFACFSGAFCAFLGFCYSRKINFFGFSFLARAKYLHRL
jgi:hypothetical protein